MLRYSTKLFEAPALLAQLRRPALLAAGFASGGEASEPRQRVVDRVAEMLVARLARGDFDPSSGSGLEGSNAGAAGGAGEAGGGSPAFGAAGRGGRASGAVEFDTSVPRPLDIAAFQKALTQALTEHSGSSGTGSGSAATLRSETARQMREASPTEREALAEHVTSKIMQHSSEEVARMLAEEPLPVVRSGLAALLERSGFR
ncbi:hypothetical protein HYH03_004229 [Edaphochlamys debaryana]|uniref:Uncharacterized protein n=1 Tax=Edaphochlamys debaryana TaxID=47281 RepID=A0A836C3M1_9CHLO|nr:hypothetical protein HYH03_004229 [Edaphochlamys debaryana]|eukprot:KAG2497968.1 hypothetical protein HYH03_004229 [Edaphochlamys debaryana]